MVPSLEGTPQGSLTDVLTIHGAAVLVLVLLMLALAVWLRSRGIQQHREAEKKLRESTELYRLLTEDVADVVWKTDAGLVVTYISPVDERLRGFRADEVVGHHVFEMFTPEGIATVGQLMAKRRAAETAASPMGSVTFEAQHRCKDGRLLWAEVQSKPERDASGRITGFHGITREITEKKALQDQVRQLAFFDPLTTLANRRLLGEHLGQALTAARRNQRCGALLFLDLDNFKPLNDTHGHDVGDLLLVEAARRLKTCVRESDTVARFGGDEFVVLLNQLHAEPAEAAGQAAMVAEKVRATLSEAYHLTVMRPGEEGVAVSHLCTASVGLAVFTGGPATPEEVMKGADAAMYEAKAAGRNQVRVHGGASRAPFPARGPSLPV